MATYYVGSGGSDAAAGTSYALRWLTIGKALGATGIASGDTVYLSPGTYRESITVAMTSAVATTSIIGDTDGSHTSGVPGEVCWTNWITNDTSGPTGAVLIFSGRDYLSFSNIVFQCGGGSGTVPIDATSATSTNITFTDCYFYMQPGPAAIVSATIGAGVNATWVMDRCVFLLAPRNSTGGTVLVTLDRHSADYDANFIIRNSLFFGSVSSVIRIASTGAGAGFGGGVVVDSCSMLGSTGVATADANLSITYPCVVKNSFISASTGVSANTSGQITETYNSFNCTTARTNVSAGTGSQTDDSPRMHIGQERLYGGVLRPFLTPTSGSPLLGLGGSTPPSVDGLNRPRPSGGASTNTAAGALERHDFAVKETTTTDAGGVAIKLTGPGDHDFRIPVDATSTSITVKVYYDTNHGTGSPPQASLLANGEIAYAGETVTAAASTATWLTLTFASFTPTAKGVVTLRLCSRAAAGSGYAIFDTVTVT